MVLIVIGIIILGFGFFFAGLYYGPEKSKKKLPDYVVMADDGSDE